MSAAQGREQALREWCAQADYDPDDREAPHIEAFEAGFDHGSRRRGQDAAVFSGGEPRPAPSAAQSDDDLRHAEEAEDSLIEEADRIRQDESSAASPSRIALAVKGWRCFLGFHRWKMRSVVGRGFSFGEYSWWEVYQECARCGEERSCMEWNRRVGAKLEEAVRGR